MSGELASEDFGSAKRRLEQIADAVADDAMPLDEVLDLFEEAVALGMQISDLLEVGQDDDADGVTGANGANDSAHDLDDNAQNGEGDASGLGDAARNEGDAAAAEETAAQGMVVSGVAAEGQPVAQA